MNTILGCLCLIVMTIVATTNSKAAHGDYHSNDKHHGYVAMGIPNSECDDAMWNTEIDWDDSTDAEYKCHGFMQSDDVESIPPLKECISPENMPEPLHKCMNTKIDYPDLPPMAGPHRPLWPVYGEYLYIPPQRWIHALEHGAAVFLYDPCADLDQIEIFKNLAKGCLRRHIIGPYRKLADGMYFAVLTYGCRLQMQKVDEMLIINFVKKYALTAPERHVSKDGDYNKGLIQKAVLVTDASDSKLCPKSVEDMLIAEIMNGMK